MVSAILMEPKAITGMVDVDTRTDEERELDQIAEWIATGAIRNREELRSCMTRFAEEHQLLFHHACDDLGSRIQLRRWEGYVSDEMYRTFDEGILDMIRQDPLPSQNPT